LRRAGGAGIVAVPAIALAAWLAYGSGFVDYDAVYALVWGDDLAHGHRPPDLDSRHSPTSHPLATLLSVPLSQLGSGALGVLQAASLLSFGALGWAAYRLGERTFGRPTGALFAAILLTRPLLVKQALSANVDVPFVALVLGAAAMEAGRPRRGWPVLALLAVAGLLRPEAWLLAVAYAAWLWPALGDARSRAAVAALALAGPAGWALFDWVVAGDPLHSMHETSQAAERIGRPQGADRAVRLAPGYLIDVLTAAVAVGGAAAALAALRLARARARVPVATGLLGGAAFLALGLGDQPLLARYLFVPGAMLALPFAAAATAWWVPGLRAAGPGTAPGGGAGGPLGPRAALAVTAVFAVAALASVPATVRDVDDWRDFSEARHRADGELPELLDSAAARRTLDRCVPATVDYFQTRPLVAYLLGDRRPNDVDTAQPARATGGALLVARSRAGEVPHAFRLAASSRSWALFDRCGPPTPEPRG
jgi:hypothetical protein